jgi:hypothetical protein
LTFAPITWELNKSQHFVRPGDKGGSFVSLFRV